MVGATSATESVVDGASGAIESTVVDDSGISFNDKEQMLIDDYIVIQEKVEAKLKHCFSQTDFTLIKDLSDDVIKVYGSSNSSKRIQLEHKKIADSYWETNVTRDKSDPQGKPYSIGKMYVVSVFEYC